MQVDVERFIEWLRLRGEPESHLPAYRHYAGELVHHGDVIEAVRAAQAAGAPAQRITNLRQTAAFISEFSGGSRPIPVLPAEMPAGSKPTQTADPYPRLEIEASGPRKRPSALPPFELKAPRKNCECRKRYDVYIDNDFGVMAKLLGGSSALMLFILVRMVGIFGAGALALGLAALGGTVTIISICFRCEGCRRTIRDLDADEGSTLRKSRALVTLVTLGLYAGAAVCALLWWMAFQAQYHGPE